MDRKVSPGLNLYKFELVFVIFVNIYNFTQPIITFVSLVTSFRLISYKYEPH